MMAYFVDHPSSSIKRAEKHFKEGCCYGKFGSVYLCLKPVHFTAE